MNKNKLLAKDRGNYIRYLIFLILISSLGLPSWACVKLAKVYKVKLSQVGGNFDFTPWPYTLKFSGDQVKVIDITRSSSFQTVNKQCNNISFNLPLPTVSAANTNLGRPVSVIFTCSGNLLSARRLNLLCSSSQYIPEADIQLQGSGVLQEAATK